MDKITYLNELEHRLKKLPSYRIDEVMTKYEQYFYEEGENGKTDKEIVKMLDSPKKVAKQSYAAYAVKNAEKKPDFVHITRALVATIGMSIITLFIIMIPLFFVSLFVLAGAFISIGMILAPAIVLISTMWVGVQYFSLSNFIFSMSFLGLGIVFIVIITKIVLVIRYAIIRYLTWNINFIKKGTVKE
ncbi:HAAS signaling domain-containing protein [Staphylococcus felis]|uniref:DUF1700 domain-containing protein n=1 Tax=Staphylococcus felis TaxID=46127 RepID=A0A3E0IMH5_9STAP|nr:DUF1700 domain-containing protein [Staphylococcus felis]REH85363.1 hypothetical protein DOS61_04385 [Staphylococcus felis]REH89420.1 hypothetical protein DOS58_06700 [Staphylococcus felis]REH92334.1 hypothetical protein DOS83_10485 [Staphylococcus felis]